MKSILQQSKRCYLCGRGGRWLHEHHIFEGSRRQKSEEYGLKVWLCVKHHTGAEGAHSIPGVRELLHKAGQRKFEETHTREEFIRIFGKSYL